MPAFPSKTIRDDAAMPSSKRWPVSPHGYYCTASSGAQNPPSIEYVSVSNHAAERTLRYTTSPGDALLVIELGAPMPGVYHAKTDAHRYMDATTVVDSSLRLVCPNPAMEVPETIWDCCLNRDGAVNTIAVFHGRRGGDRERPAPRRICMDTSVLVELVLRRLRPLIDAISSDADPGEPRLSLMIRGSSTGMTAMLGYANPVAERLPSSRGDDVDDHYYFARSSTHVRPYDSVAFVRRWFEDTVRVRVAVAASGDSVEVTLSVERQPRRGRSVNKSIVEHAMGLSTDDVVGDLDEAVMNAMHVAVIAQVVKDSLAPVIRKETLAQDVCGVAFCHVCGEGSVDGELRRCEGCHQSTFCAGCGAPLEGHAELCADRFWGIEIDCSRRGKYYRDDA